LCIHANVDEYQKKKISYSRQDIAFETILYVHDETAKPEPVVQSVGSLTAVQKEWGSIPIQVKAK
jgi:hypothetical protein